VHNGRVFWDLITSSSAHRLLGQASNRRRLTFYPPSSGAIVISNNQNVTASTGIYFATGAAPLYLDVDFHGDCVTQEWYGIYTGGGSGVAWIETLCYGEGHDHAHDSDAGRRAARVA
jgi:hypothetical protein